MHIHRNTAVFATRFIRKLRGGSQPILIGASDGKQYIIKFANNLQGPNVLCNEVLGTELYRAIGLPAPGWTPILITNRFIRENPRCRIENTHGSVEPKTGLSFGSELVGDCEGSLFEILPGSYWARVSNRSDFWLAWLVDLCAEHYDNRQAVFRRNGAALSAVFIDHGHMFGGPDGTHRPPLLGPRHLDYRVYEELDVESQMNLRRICANINSDELLSITAKIPDRWATDSAVRNFLACIDRLSRADFWQDSLEAMLASFHAPEANAHSFLSRDQVLRSCLRLAASGRSAVA